VQEPLTSFNEDVTATRRVLDSLDGPCVLVGHSYGGAIMTEAGNDDHVKSLVYIAAHALDVGETEASNGKKYPNSTKAVVKTPDSFLYLNPADYPSDFAADLPRAQAEFEAHAQMPTSAAVFTAQIPDPGGRKSRVGIWSRERTRSSTRTSSACTRRGRTRTRWKWAARATRCMNPIRRKSADRTGGFRRDASAYDREGAPCGCLPDQRVCKRNCSDRAI
jgi:pimeloyl-ACP methyl ester carboxylesterase